MFATHRLIPSHDNHNAVFFPYHRQDRIQNDTYIPPHAALELGIVYVEMDKLEEGKEWLEKSRSEYKGFLVEALVHLRTHAAFREVSDRQKALSASTVDPDSERTAANGSAGSAAQAKADPPESSTIRRPSGFGSWIKSFV